MMRPQDWFVLGVRLFGVWALYNSVTYLASYIGYEMGYRLDYEKGTGAAYLTQAVAHLVLALYLLGGTRHLARLTFREEWEKNSGEGGHQPLQDPKEALSEDVGQRFAESIMEKHPRGR